MRGKEKTTQSLQKCLSHTHTHVVFRSVCLAANIIIVLTALVNSSTQNKLSGSVGASSGEFHCGACVCVCVCIRVRAGRLLDMYVQINKHSLSQQNSQSYPWLEV